MAAGTDGILVRPTGEFPALDEDERMAVAEAAIEQATGRIAVGVHVGTPATRSTVRLARHAVAAGADAVAAVTPYYLKTDGPGLAQHLEAVKEVAPEVPLLAYSIGRLTGYEHPLDVLGDLAGRGVLQGVKESGDELGRLVAIREACGPDFAIFAGSPHLQAACLAHGADGSILGLANAAPAECAEVARLAAAGDHGAAAALAARLRPAAAALGPRDGARRRQGALRAALRHLAAPARAAPRADRRRARARARRAARGGARRAGRRRRRLTGIAPAPPAYPAAWPGWMPPRCGRSSPPGRAPASSRSPARTGARSSCRLVRRRRRRRARVHDRGETIKARSLRRDGRASLCVDDEQPPFAYARLDGRVTLSDDRDGAARVGEPDRRALHGRGARREFGRRNAVPGELLVRLAPERVFSEADVTG